MGEGFGSLPILISFFFLIKCYRYDKRGITFRLYKKLGWPDSNNWRKRYL